MSIKSFGLVLKTVYLSIPFKGFRYKSRDTKTMSKIVWIDMEMTGLDVEKDRIMEIACLITDNNLKVLAEHPTIVIHQPDSLLDSMDEWCTSTHTKVTLQSNNLCIINVINQ